MITETLMLVTGFLVTWGLGLALLLALAERRAQSSLPSSRAVPLPGELAWTVGCGWFVGAFLLTLWMRALSLAHVPFGVASIGLPLAVAAALLGWWARRSGPSPFTGAVAAITARQLAGWRRLIWLALLGWLAVRFALLLTEIVWRPLYPWDAWTQWGTKARVWFELKTMAPFVTASEWLQALGANVYFDAAPHYPATVPLLQAWAATLLGRWDDTLINLPWWLTGLAFALAVYGYLVQQGFGSLEALVGTWLVLSLPILDVHIALAGYADLAMSTYLTLAALASLRAIRTRHWGDAAIAALLLAACVLIKNPGKIWVLVLVPGLIAAFWQRYGLRIAAACFAAAIFAILVAARAEPVILGYRLHLAFGMPWRALFDAYFAYANWHLLWYGAAAMTVLAWRELLSREMAPYTLIVSAGLLFLLFGFAFTNARVWVEDQSTVNRATLHLAPLLIVWMLLAFRAWARQVVLRSEIAAETRASPAH